MTHVDSLSHTARARAQHRGSRVHTPMSQLQNSSCLPLPDIGPSLLSIDHSRDSRSHPPGAAGDREAQLLPLLRLLQAMLLQPLQKARAEAS